ncbi:hypothetical protein GCM10022259_41300 [Aquimarina mytili]
MSGLVTYYITNINYSSGVAGSAIANDTITLFTIQTFVIWLIYFSTLIILPFTVNYWIQRFSISQHDWWKVILVLESFAILFSYLATPPDMISTLLFFAICQPLVITNTIVVILKLKR